MKIALLCLLFLAGCGTLAVPLGAPASPDRVSTLHLQVTNTSPDDLLFVPVACSSNSMGNTLGCNDTLIVRRENATFVIGSIYVYDNGNGSTVHRLVQIVGNGLVFKGDNNLVAELVQPEQVQYKVIGVWYHG